MAFQIADLYATVRADDAQLRGALPRIRRSLDRVHASMQRVAYVARRMFVAVAGVIALSVKMASDAEEAHNKFMVVFKNEALAVTKWAADYGKAVGRAKVDMEAWLAGTQDILVPLGIARTEATGLSKAIVKLGMDIASFSNKADATVIRDLQSALTGQTRAVLSYGIVVNEAAVKQELLNMGITQSYATVANATKVMARLNVIMAASKDAQGDLIRTQGSFENQLKALIGTWKDFMASLGTAFIPIAGRVVSRLREITESFGKWITDNREAALTIGLVTLAVTGLLAVLPVLIGALSVVLLHPFIAGLMVIAALLSTIIARMYLLKEARKAAFAERVEDMTSEDLRKQIVRTEKELALARKTMAIAKNKLTEALAVTGGMRPGAGAPPRDTQVDPVLAKHIKHLKEALEIDKKQLAIRVKTEKAIAEAKKKSEKEIAELTETARKKAADDEAERSRKAAQTARALHEEAKRHAAVIVRTFDQSTFADEMKALADKLDLQGKKAAGGTPGVMAFDQLARRIQEAAFNRDQEKAEKELVDATKANTRQMKVLTEKENDLINAITDPSGGMLGGVAVV